MNASASHQVLLKFAGARLQDMQQMLETVPELLSEGSALRLDWIARSERDRRNAEVLASRAALIRLCLQKGVAAAFESLTSTPAPVSEEELREAVRHAFKKIAATPDGAPSEIAALYDCALRSVPQNLPPQRWFPLLADRAAALFKLGVLSGNRTILRGSIHCFDGLLKVIDGAASPGHWAAFQQNRGNALTRLGELAGDPEIIQAAIDGFDAALEGFLRASDRNAWAITLQSRANALESLFERAGDMDLLLDSLENFDAVLEVHTRKTNPNDWALALQNKGNVLRTLGELKGDPILLEQAIAAFDAALEIRTRETDPRAWAGTQQNRADAIGRLGTFNWDAALLGLAISGYDAALGIVKRENAPADWARIQQNKAIALARLGDIIGDPPRVREAIDGYEAALTVRTMEAGPADWAVTRQNLAVALYTLGGMTGNQALLREALACFDSVLTVVTREAGMAQWANVQRNKADALRVLGDFANDSSITGQALSTFREALAAMSMEAEPDAYMATCGSLVRPLFERGEYDEIRALLDGALTAGLRHLRSLTNRVAQERAVQQAAWLAELRAWIAITVDSDPDGALLWLERGRAQLLALALPVDPKRAPVDHFRALSDLLGAIPDDGAAVLPIITPAGARIAVIPGGRSAVGIGDFLDLPGLTRVVLETWFYGEAQAARQGGYLDAYHAAQPNWGQTPGTDDGTDASDFDDVLRSTIEQVWHELLCPVDARLCELGLAAKAPVTIVPPGLLSLLPLWAAAPDLARWPEGEPFGARWTVSQSPSLSVLSVIRQRGADWNAHGSPVSGLAVLDPASDGQGRLPGASLEGGILERHVAQDRLLRLDGADATAAAVHSGLAGRSHIHFSAHGFYSPAVPNLSAVLLAGSDRLTLADLQNIEAVDDLRLVVLSACDTGLPGLQRGRADEFIGLPVGFIQAGAAAVIASHWPVRDDAAFFLMWRFYEEYFDGAGAVRRDPAGALRDASLWLRSVTFGELGLLFEPARDPDGNPIPRTIDRQRPRDLIRLVAADANEARAASISVPGHSTRILHRRVEDADETSATAGERTTFADNSAAYGIGMDIPDWEQVRPFADPIHWAAFSITGS